MVDYIKMALLLLLVLILLIPLILPIIGLFLRKDTEKQLFNTLNTTPDLDVNSKEAVAAVAVAQIYSKNPIRSELCSGDLVWVNRHIRKEIFIESKSYNLPGGDAYFCNFSDAWIVVDGVEISMDLSNVSLLYEQKVHRDERELRRFLQLNDSEKRVVEDQAEALGRIEEIPGKVPLFRIQENRIENGEEIAVMGIYDPKEKRLSMPEGVPISIVRNWRRDKNQRLYELCDINDPTIYVPLEES